MPRVARPPGHVLYALGSLIGRQRRAHGLTQREMAALIGHGWRTVQQYERGLLEPPIETLIRIAHACDLPLSTFVAALDDFEPPLRTVRPKKGKACP